MKITKSQLRKIVLENKRRVEEKNQFNESVREAYAEHLLLTQPKKLYSGGQIDETTMLRAQRMRALNESGQIDEFIQEAFFDDVKALAAKVGAKAKEKGKEVAGAAADKAKELGGKALDKAKEIGNKEIDTKKFAKDASRVGKEAGEMAAGAAEGMWNAIGAVASKLGGKAAKAAQNTLKGANKNIPQLYDQVAKLVGTAAGKAKGAAKAGVKGAAGAIGDTAAGLAGLIVKAKEGLSLEQMAKNEPDAFLDGYRQLDAKLKKMHPQLAKTPETAEAALGVFESPDGQAALAHGAKKAGVTAAEFKSLVALYVLKSKYVDMAMKSQGQKAESRIRRGVQRKLTEARIRRSILNKL